MLVGARIFHVNINCTDLARSSAFYLDGCGLIEGVRTTPEAAEPGTAFGLDRAWWDAVILVGASGFDGGAIDLLQWLDPIPTGHPPATLSESGFQRVGLHVPDLDGAVARCAARGGNVVREPEPRPGPDGRSRRVALVRDPDGAAVELVEQPDEPGARLAFVAVVCRDIERSQSFYGELGFVEVARPDGEVTLEAPAGGEVGLRLVGGAPGDVVPGGARPANALGIWRTALLLDNLDGAVRDLGRAGAELLSDPQSMAMGPELPELRFVCARGPDAEVIELIETPADVG